MNAVGRKQRLSHSVAVGPLLMVREADARQFANALALAYKALGLSHLDNAAR